MEVNILSASLRRADFYACFASQNHQEMENRIEGRKALRRRTTDPLLPSIIHEASERAQVHASRSKARAASAEANRKGHKFPRQSSPFNQTELQYPHSGQTNWPLGLLMGVTG